MLPHAVGDFQNELRQIAVVVGQHVGVGLRHYVQHHIVIFGITVVAVGVPLAAAQVNFHVAHPQRIAYAHLCVEEVGSRIAVVQARVQHLHLASVSGRELVQRQQLVLPHIVKYFFHRRQSYEKSRAKQRNSFLFLPRRSQFALAEGKVTKLYIISQIFTLENDQSLPIVLLNLVHLCCIHNKRGDFLNLFLYDISYISFGPKNLFLFCL